MRAVVCIPSPHNRVGTPYFIQMGMGRTRVKPRSITENSIPKAGTKDVAQTLEYVLEACLGSPYWESLYWESLYWESLYWERALGR